MDLSPTSRKLAIIESKSLCMVLRAMTITIVSQGSQPRAIAT